MGLRGVVFDFDGVLVDSEGLHFRALRESLRPEGIDIDAGEYARRYLAYDDREAARVALEVHRKPSGPDRVTEIAERKARLFEQMLPEVPFFPGARELVRGLAARMPVAIASGALRGEIERILDGGGLRDAFTAIVGADDVQQCKPHPEPYLEAVRRLGPGITPAECLAFEDSVAGIASARAAGLVVVGVATSYPAAKLQSAHHVVGSLSELPVERLAELGR
jgi:beta-phosphoglucomutase